MNQELTLSADFVRYLYDNPPGYYPTVITDIIKIIEQNKLISDKSKTHFQKLIYEIDKLPDDNKKSEIKNLVEHWLMYKSHFLPSAVSDEISLSLCSQDKIYFSPLISSKEIKKLALQHPDLEVHNTGTFCNPDHYYRLKNVPCSISFENGICYNFGQILNPLLRKTENIKIVDQYLPNKKSISNLDKIFSVIDLSASVLLCTLSLNTYVNKNGPSEKKLRRDTYNEFLDFVNCWKNKGLKIKLEYFRTSKHIDRYIITDNIKIQIPSFDFIDESGYVNCIDSNDIQLMTVTFLNSY